MPTLDLDEALRLIRTTPGYIKIGVELAQRAADNRIIFNRVLEDRAQTSLTGVIALGPEAVQSSPLSLAQTLVHEHFHLHQNPLQKTTSFWLGAISRTATMRRYEQPAYQAAIDFLETVKRAHPHLRAEAENEQAAVRQVFAGNFGGALN